VNARLLPLVLLLTPSASHATPLCERTPNPARWSDAGTPDAGRAHTDVMVHRGAANLAPENSIAAIEYAVAYDVDHVEIDVQQTIDGGYVLFHDQTVDSKTDGSGYIAAMTFEQATALNAADNPTWKGSVYDPSPIISLDAALARANELEVGFSFDLKESVTNAAGVALAVKAYPDVFTRSIFQPYVQGRTEQIIAATPDATIMLNPLVDIYPNPAYYAFARSEYAWFGSDLDVYPAARIAAIHDGCGLVLPNVYSNNRTQEAAGIAAALARGADGVMVNNPDVAMAALDRPVATRIALDDAADRACLVGNENQGLPGKPVTVDGVALTTGRGGCVAWSGGPVGFAGDASALASSA
jgi:glycerophosphoryl diester phosphodiesterase